MTGRTKTSCAGISRLFFGAFMKKLPFFIGLCSFLAVSCTAGKNEFGWYTDFETAKKAAQSQKKNIVLFVSSFQDFEGSSAAVQTLTHSRAFTDAVKNSYVCVHFDFAKADNLIEENDSTAKEKKRLRTRQADIKAQFAVADSYAVQYTPTALITTAEGYYVGRADFNYGRADAEEYATTLEAQKEAVRMVNEQVQAIQRASGVKKVQAIDALYTSTPQNVRAPLTSLVHAVPRIDQKNESGLVSAYLREAAYLDAYERLKTSGGTEAADVYEKAAADERLLPADRQRLYYAAAHTLAMNGGNSERIMSLFRAAFAAAPESPAAKKIALTIDHLQTILSMQNGASNGKKLSQVPSPVPDDKHTDSKAAPKSPFTVPAN